MTVTNTAASSRVTQEGTVVGTFQYMSPEQVEGKELDGRSDIFSLGAVLYEMLTGKRAFEGKSPFSVASAILEKEPAPIPSIKPLTPRSLDHVVRRCLAKDPDDRWQSARDLALVHFPPVGAHLSFGHDQLRCQSRRQALPPCRGRGRKHVPLRFFKTGPICFPRVLNLERNVAPTSCGADLRHTCVGSG